jgi:alpha-tubulin suppressor-like RCC1 family protein
MYFTKGINQNGYMLCRYCNMKKYEHPIFIYIYNITYQCDDIVLLIQEYIKINNYKNIAGGLKHSIVLLQDNTVKCWGINNKGQCDVPDSIQGRVVSIDCGSYHSCALLNDNTVKCWGKNSYEQCKPPDYIQGKVISIGCGNYHSIAVLNDMTVVCWGNNKGGQCNVPEES